jgi:hypothetical protein
MFVDGMSSQCALLRRPLNDSFETPNPGGKLWCWVFWRFEVRQSVGLQGVIFDCYTLAVLAHIQLQCPKTLCLEGKFLSNRAQPLP